MILNDYIEKKIFQSNMWFDDAEAVKFIHKIQESLVTVPGKQCTISSLTVQDPRFNASGKRRLITWLYEWNMRRQVDKLMNICGESKCCNLDHHTECEY